jgi:DinB superfamily
VQAKDAIKSALNSTQSMLGMYLADLSDADLLVRPVPNANHIAWQLGHLINSEPELIHMELPDAPYPKLPAGFAEQHSKTTAAVDPPKGFGTKAEYLALAKEVRTATLALLDRVDVSRASTGKMAKWAPTLADLFLMLSTHTMMHAGQFTVVRRKLGKPLLM